MARYKNYCYEKGKMISVSFREQILPGTFEYTLSYLIDHELDISVFDDAIATMIRAVRPTIRRCC